MIQNIYILGGEGFIGMNLAEYFGIKENCKVYLIGKRKSIFLLPNNIKVNKKYCDIYNCDFKIKRDSIIIHLARFSFENLNDFKYNEKKLENYINGFFPKKIIVFSSSVMYTKQFSIYRQEKEIFENIWKGTSTIIRLFNTYGKYQLPNKQGSLILTIFYDYLTGNITEINDINQIRNFIYAGDIGKNISKIIDNNFNGIIDIGNKTITIGELLKDIGQIIGMNSIKIIGNNEVIFNKEPNNIIEIKYTKLLDGLTETCKYMKNNISKYKKIGKKN